MDLNESIARREESIIHALESKQAAIDNFTGKGSATEAYIERELIRPYLQPGFDCVKGSILDGPPPGTQSAAIDRVIFDRRVAPPLVYDEEHSILPIEVVAGLVEITMHLDRGKLATDIARMHPMRAMRTRRYLTSVPNSQTAMRAVEADAHAPRSFVVGLPADSRWQPQTIGRAFLEIQAELGADAHVHGLYVLGIGFFETVPTTKEGQPARKLRAWLGTDRLFRFIDALRTSLDRWPTLPGGASADLRGYLSGEPLIITEKDG